MAWNTYLARCSYLLQQGKFVGDLAYFYGEGAPATVPFWKPVNPAPPAGYGYDWMNADVMLNRMSVERRPAGAARWHELPGAGAAGLRRSDDTAGTAQNSRPGGGGSDGRRCAARPLARRAWLMMPRAEYSQHRQRSLGRRWTAGRDRTRLRQGKGLLGQDRCEKSWPARRPRRTLSTTGRRLTPTWCGSIAATAIADIYFVANQKDRAEDVKTSFRVEGKEAELWHPDTGVTEPAEYRIENGRTQRAAASRSLTVRSSWCSASQPSAPSPNAAAPRQHGTGDRLDGPWQVNFPPNWGAPPQVQSRQAGLLD